MSKLISTFQIRFDDKTKAEIDSLKAKLDEVTRALSVKNDSHGDRLLAAMQAEAANDSNSFVPIHYEAQLHGGWVRHFNVDLLKPTINRETVNDVDYLSGSDLDESVPTIQGMEASYAIMDEAQNYWQAESVPQITQADMQLIFIKNLSETLIQRMHSMDRFSDDDYAIGGKSLESWDIVFCELIDAYAILTRHKNGHYADLLILGGAGPVADAGWCADREAFKTLRTITEAELSEFRTALEACYA